MVNLGMFMDIHPTQVLPLVSQASGLMIASALMIDAACKIAQDHRPQIAPVPSSAATARNRHSWWGLLHFTWTICLHEVHLLLLDVWFAHTASRD